MNFISYGNNDKEEGKNVLGDLLETNYGCIFYDKATDTNMIEQQMMMLLATAERSSWLLMWS